MTSNQVVSTILDIKSSIHIAIFVPFQDQDEDPGLGAHYVMWFSQVAMEIIWACKIFQYNHHDDNITDIYTVT